MGSSKLFKQLVQIQKEMCYPLLRLCSGLLGWYGSEAEETRECTIVGSKLTPRWCRRPRIPMLVPFTVSIMEMVLLDWYAQTACHCTRGPV